MMTQLKAQRVNLYPVMEKTRPSDKKQELFMALYKPTHQKLSNFCFSRTNDIEDARDLISETFARAYEHFETLKNEKAFLSFLFGIAIRIIRNKERRRKFRGFFSQDQAEKIPANQISPELSYDVQVLYQALERLPALQKEAVILFEISGFSMKEISEIQGGSLSAIKLRILRGREKLKVIMASDNNY